MTLEQMIQFLRMSVSVQDKDKVVEQDPQYLCMTDEDLLLYLNLAMSRNYSDTPALKYLPEDALYGVIILAKKELYYTLAVKEAPLFDMGADNNNYLKRSQRFDHYMKLIVQADKEYEDWLENGGEDGFGLQFSINTLDENDRNEMFRNRSLSLQEISDIIKELPYPKKRKYTLNFAVTSKSNLDVDLMNKYFDKEKCIVKMTPIHETVEAVDEGYEIVHDFDVYEQFEQPLVNDGWDVIVFVPSKEEDKDRITCGNSLIALGNK